MIYNSIIISCVTWNRVSIYNVHRYFFALDSKNPKYQKIIFLLTDKFPVHHGILISITRTRNIFLELCITAKQAFSTTAKVS